MTHWTSDYTVGSLRAMREASRNRVMALLAEAASEKVRYEEIDRVIRRRESMDAVVAREALTGEGR